MLLGLGLGSPGDGLIVSHTGSKIQLVYFFMDHQTFNGIFVTRLHVYT